MSVPVILDHAWLRPHRRVVPLAAVGLARLLSSRRPARIRRVLLALRRGARPATAEETLRARREVVAVSVACAGQGCLQRSLAVAVLCRLRGTWPTWCTGVRTDPFRAHAWVQVGDTPVGEADPPGYFRPLITVPPTS